MYRGCAEPLLARKRHAGDYHGKDGLGDVPDPDAPGLELVQRKKAVAAMIKIVNRNPGEVRQAWGCVLNHTEALLYIEHITYIILMHERISHLPYFPKK